MLKKLLIVVVASIFLIGAFMSIDAFARGEKNNNPFELIWQKLFDHEERISDLEEQPSSAGIEVYDANGQYLGILLTNWGYGMEVYIPEMDITMRFSLRDGTTGTPTLLFFESDDCSGVSYALSDSPYTFVINAGKYYLGERIAPILIQYNSYLKTDGLTCGQRSNTTYLVPVHEITPDLNIPVALPLSFK